MRELTARERRSSLALAPRRPARTLVALGCAILLGVGCATSSDPLSELASRWEGLDSVVVAPAGERTVVRVWAQSAKTGAGEAAITAMQVAALLAMGRWPIAFYGAGLVAVPLFGAGVGAVVGVIKSPPDEELERVHATLFHEIGRGRLPQRLQDRAIELIEERWPDKRVAPMRIIPVPGPERYSALADRPVDAVLEFDIADVLMRGPWGSGRWGPMVVTGSFRLLRPSDDETLGEGRFDYAPADPDLGVWWLAPSEENPDPARSLRAALDRAVLAIAVEIVDMLEGVDPDAGR